MISPMPKGTLIAPSILSADFLVLGEQIREAEAAGCDWFHIDVMDGHFVPNITMGPVVVEAVRRATKLPLDVHLMIENPEKYVHSFAEAGADGLTVHVETTEDLPGTLNVIQELGLRAGVALNPDTPMYRIGAHADALDLMLVMTVNPGFSGQAFIPEVLPKVEQAARWRREGRTEALIEVDGGISAETAQIAAVAGAQVFVAASAIFKHEDGIGAGIQALRTAIDRVEVAG
jgi:ribulose-phosphate 3-epimerase